MGIHATNSGVVDWIALRIALAEYRRTAGMEEAELAAELSISKSTVYRIENTEDEPDHKPKLQTIDAWLRATNAGPLSALFTQLEAASISRLQTDMTSQNNLDIIGKESNREVQGEVSEKQPPPEMISDVAAVQNAERPRPPRNFTLEEVQDLVEAVAAGVRASVKRDRRPASARPRTTRRPKGNRHSG